MSIDEDSLSKLIVLKGCAIMNNYQKCLAHETASSNEKASFKNNMLTKTVNDCSKIHRSFIS